MAVRLRSERSATSAVEEALNDSDDALNRGAAGDLAPAERRVHRRRAVEVDPLDVGPKHVLGALTAVDEDQHAGIPLAEVAGVLELQLLATMEGHPSALGAAFIAAGGHDRGDQAEGDGVVHALGWGVERLGGLALVEVEDQPTGEAGRRAHCRRD